MKGYPKHMNTKKDVINAMELSPKRTAALLRRAIAGREGWYTVARLENQEDGVVDDTHRVVDMGDEDEGVQEWYQQEWGPLPGNKLDRLGLSVTEADELIEQASGYSG